MKKIIIIGSPGAGKSIFARRLKDKTGLPLYHLDLLWHRADKTTVSKEQFDFSLNEILTRAEWIIDGNYSRTLEIRFKFCDTVILLDYPIDICLDGVKCRIGKKREDIPWIEDKLDGEFREWILDFPNKQLPKIYGLLDQYKDEITTVIFKSREESEKYLNEI